MNTSSLIVQGLILLLAIGEMVFYPDFLTKEEQEVFDRFVRNIDNDIL